MVQKVQQKWLLIGSNLDRFYFIYLLPAFMRLFVLLI